SNDSTLVVQSTLITFELVALISLNFQKLFIYRGFSLFMATDESSSEMVQLETKSKQQTRSANNRVFKIVVLGDGGVGKSALTLQFVSHSFFENHDPTIEDSYQQQAVIDGQVALLDILDTAGQMEFTAMRDQYMRAGEGFIICYSITDRRSFEEALEYYKLVSKVRNCDHVPIVLVGNKYDLEQHRKVSTEEGQVLAHRYACPFFETSAALRLFVDDIFHALIREIREIRGCDKAISTRKKRVRMS
uniref:small monomeric GTPase n=1 Tax=Strigamia maritima TaxID=126957 RepID=T1IWJ0_STRMM